MMCRMRYGICWCGEYACGICVAFWVFDELFYLVIIFRGGRMGVYQQGISEYK